MVHFGSILKADRRSRPFTTVAVHCKSPGPDTTAHPGRMCMRFTMYLPRKLTKFNATLIDPSSGLHPHRVRRELSRSGAVWCGIRRHHCGDPGERRVAGISETKQTRFYWCMQSGSMLSLTLERGGVARSDGRGKSANSGGAAQYRIFYHMM